MDVFLRLLIAAIVRMHQMAVEGIHDRVDESLHERLGIIRALKQCLASLSNDEI